MSDPYQDRPGVPWTNPPGTPTLDWAQPPWTNPPSTPTLDFVKGGDTIPPEVSGAIGRFRMGAASDRDRQILVDFLTTNGDSLSANEQMALGDIIHAMGGDLASTSADTGSTPGFTYVPGGGDIRSQATAQASAPANLPTPTPPPITQTAEGIPLPPPIQGSSPTAFPGMSSTWQTGVITSPPRPGMPPTNLPTPTPAVPGSMPAGGYGASNILSRAARQDARGQARGGQGANWKMIEGLGGNSAFSDISPQYLGAYAANPQLAAQEIANQGLPPGTNANITAQGLEPLTGSALAMANLGLLGGGKGHGLGGPSSAGQQLGRAEALVNSLGPGQYIDPGAVMRRTMHRADKTPIGDLYSGQGDPNDIMQQVSTTQNAILAPLKGVATDAAYNGTAAMLDQEANAWLQAVAHGDIDPNQVSYPAWLREHHRQRFLGR